MFPAQDFEFRFGVRPGDVAEFFADTVDNATLMAGRLQALDETPAHHLFEESSAAEAISECLA